MTDALGGEMQIAGGRLGRLTWLPFEALVAVMMVITGWRTIRDPAPLLPDGPLYLAVMIAWFYLVGGGAILLGLLRSWRRVEMVGLLALTLSVLVATTVAVIGYGPDVIYNLIVYVGAGFASTRRLYDLATGRALVVVELRR